jgi:Ser/Thr protein kinase RdoA (MazF antagonist)
MNNVQVSETVGIAAAKAFGLSENGVKMHPFGSGHINDTYKLTTADPEEGPFLLQRINHFVFPNVEQLMDNMVAVTAHLKNKIDQSHAGNSSKEVLTILHTKEGKPFYQDELGNYWRLFTLLDQTRSYDLVTTPMQAREGGRAFGKFQRLLGDFDANQLHVVLPRFHNILFRLEQLSDAIKHNPLGRAEEVNAELACIDQFRQRAIRLQTWIEKGKLPMRVTHNDTKFNNVLLDMQDRAQCVIDLDTVMPGYVAFDFGDAIRTAANMAEEDESDTTKIGVNLPIFEAFTKGYFEEAGSFLTVSEIDSLIEGVLLLPYMQAVRFLTDYINGDVYYKVQHSQHNLQRARAQLAYFKALKHEEQNLLACIEKEANNK